jgi:hypothetical protein
MARVYTVYEIGRGPVGEPWVTEAGAERYADGLRKANPGRRYVVRSRIADLSRLVQMVA